MIREILRRQTLKFAGVVKRPSRESRSSSTFGGMEVLYYDECKWQDMGEGLIFHFVDIDGNCLAEIALKDSESQLWKFEVMLPDRHRVNEINPAGLVFAQTGARRVVEMILLNTIVTR